MSGISHENGSCFKECNNNQGPCTFCGNGHCCRKNIGGDWNDTTKGCDGYAGGEVQPICIQAGEIIKANRFEITELKKH